MLQLVRLRSLVRLIFLLFLCFSLPEKSYGQYPSLPAPAGIADTLQAIWEDEVNNFNSEGGIIAVYLPGKWYWAGESGNALLNPPTLADTSMSFRVGSLSKSILAASLLKLQEQGSLDLDDLITQYLNPSDAALIPNSAQISIRQLLNHKSGIGNYTSSNAFATTLAVQGLGHVFSPQDLIGFGTAQGASFPPGASWEYSNTNYVVAALVIESVSGLPYENFIENNLLNPLGMNDSYFPTTDTLPGSFMGSYFDINQSPPKENFSYLDPSGSYGAGPLASKLPDMIHWFEALVEGNVLTPASQTELLSFVNASWPNIDYGLGIGEYNNGTYSAIGHTGAIFNSSNIQYVNGANYYVVYNLTDQDFPHFPFMDRLYELLNPYIQTCAGFQPGHISGPAIRGMNVGESILLQAPIQAGMSYEWLKDGKFIPGVTSSSYSLSQTASYQVRMISSAGCVALSNEVTIVDCSPYQVEIDAVGTVASYCSGTTVQLNAGSSNDSINWLNNNGLLLANSNSYSFIADQNTSLFISASDSIGCRASDSLSIQILPQAQTDLGEDISACTGTPLNLSTGLAGDSVNWYNQNGGLLLANSQNYSFNLQNTGAVISEVINSCNTARDTLNLTVLQSPLVNLGEDQRLCVNSPLNFQVANPDDSVNWYSMSGQLLLANSNTYSLNLDNSGNLIAEAINSCGSSRDTVFLEALPAPNVDLGPDFTACVGTNLSFSVGNSGDLVNWFDSNGSLLQANSLDYSFNLSSSLTLLVERISSCGSARDTVNIGANTVAQIDIGADRRVCEGEEILISAGNTSESIDWKDLNGSLLATDTSEISLRIETNISLIAELSSACGTDADTLEIIAVPLPIVDLGPDTAIVAGERISFVAGQRGDIVNWYDGNGNLLLGNNTNFFLNPLDPISIIAEVINPDNCVGRDSIFIDMVMGIERIQDIGLSLAPNPAQDYVSLAWESHPLGEWQWEIRSLNGQLLMQGSSLERTKRLDVSGLAEGTYLFRIQTSRRQAYQLVQIRP